MNNYLEYQIDKLITKIDSMGYHAHKNHSQRTHDGRYIKGEPFDYEMFLPSYLACFDAKMCEAKKYKLLEKDIKQINNLKKCKKVGIDSFFLIYFVKEKKLLKFDVDLLINELQHTKSICMSKGSKWDIEKIIKSIDI